MAEDKSLDSQFSNVLPVGHSFKYYHVSTIPSPCTALYAPITRQEPERTYCESHSLIFTLSDDRYGKTAFLAVETHIYTTRNLTTLFVSKADSTGYTYLLDLPIGFPSINRSITSLFISHLIKHRHRPDRKLVISLFARAHKCYLFPGSDENPHKHVLDDRRLVKWWCKTLDPVLRSYEAEGSQSSIGTICSKAYLIVPGHDKYETAAFFPPTARQDPQTQQRWQYGHPLRSIAPNPAAPPRCLVPHFPDDPKSRFLDDLDEELNDVPSSQQTNNDSPSKRGLGQWKSVRTLEQFWEMMAFRQECSSGRLVGFLWMLFSPFQSGQSQSHIGIPKLAADDKDAISQTKDQPMSSTARPKQKSRSLRGKITPRTPRVKSTKTRLLGTGKLQTTRYYHSPPESRGTLVVDQKAYDRLHEILLRLDFANVEAAASSTDKWVKEAAAIATASSNEWGVQVVGRLRMADSDSNRTNPIVSSTKRKASIGSTHTESASGTSATNPTMLGAGLVRKKAKVGSDVTVSDAAPRIHTLAGGLVRKKAKP